MLSHKPFNNRQPIQYRQTGGIESSLVPFWILAARIDGLAKRACRSQIVATSRQPTVQRCPGSKSTIASFARDRLGMP